MNVYNVRGLVEDASIGPDICGVIDVWLSNCFGECEKCILCSGLVWLRNHNNKL